MKRIIEIEESIYQGIINGKKADRSVEPREIVRSFQATIADAIAQSVPYNPTGDCISRSDLKEAISTSDKFACLPDTRLVPFYELPYAEKDYVPYVHLADIVKAIDNAQAVEISGLPKIHYDRGFIAGYEKGKAERPQGEWGKWIISEIRCPICSGYFQPDCYSTEELNGCPNCGYIMKGGAE